MRYKLDYRIVRPFCRHDVYYSQPITAHDLPLVGQQRPNKFVILGQHKMLNILNMKQTSVDEHCWLTRAGQQTD